MSPSTPPDSTPHGVLLVNLGSPREPTRRGVRDFLSEFLSDPLVVDLDPRLWWLIRNLLVLPLRSGRVARAYQSIWMDEGSPLIVHGRRLVRAVSAELGAGFRVELGMRYGDPSMRAGLEALRREGCERISVLPLFPQYSQATTGTLEAELERIVASLGGAAAAGHPSIVEPYYDHPAYVGALAARARESLASGPVDHVVFSLHGLPVRYIEEGDPYRDHCEATVCALADALGLGEGDWSLAYQSRFGREEWLGPAADEHVRAMAGRAPRVLVVLPGFAADCLETLEEIGIGLVETFEEAGGEELRLVPCLNDHPVWARGLAGMLRAHAGRSRPSPVPSS